MSENRPIGYIWKSDIPEYNKLFPEIIWKAALHSTEMFTLLQNESKKESSCIALAPVPSTSVPSLALHDYLQPVDEIFSAKQLNRYLPLSLKILIQDGRIYGIPEDLNLYGFCFNQNYKSNLIKAPPTTWEELLDVLTTLKKNNVERPFHISLNKRHNNQAFIWSLFHSNGIEARSFDADIQSQKNRLIEVYQFMTQLIKFKEVIPSRALNEYFIKAPQDGNSDNQIFFMGWIKELPKAMQKPQSTLLLPFPRGTSKGQTAFPIGGTAWVIPKTTKFRDIAKKTILSIHKFDFAKSNELKGNLGIPVLKELWEDKQIQKKHPLLHSASILLNDDTKVTSDFWTNNIIKLDYSLRNGLLQKISDQQWYNRLTNNSNTEKIKLQNTIIRKIILYIEQNLNTLNNLNEISKNFSISISQLNRLFKGDLGYTCWEYVIQLKMEKAKELISSSTLSMKEISYQLGFKKATSFSKTFKKQFGVSPSWYRNHLLHKYS
ncbi:MAG: hypothetical protein COA79_06885 [Planctomycetota bacterium]|nr:MAG: hypothetical protein COA79_06885 [Planctomycetota bacterium]